MKLSSDVLVASRYQLVECLGAGAMGEVWRAQDTRFETRTVAVKFLREDETLKEDQLNRDRLTIRLEQHAARGTLTFDAALGAIVAALGTTNPEGVRTKLTAALGQAGPVRPGDVITVFDELVNDPTLNDNARMRAKLRRLFRDEANAVANLRHDNIVSIFDYGDHEGSPYLVMDYIEGRTVYQVIHDRQKLANSRRLQLIEDLCAGLGYAHRHKLVHRDIKPANLIIDSSTGSLKILDFGVVRRLGSASTVGVPVGTFCYMSPEQTKGAATLDHRSDIFAVGLVFYELMVGKKAYPPGKSIGDLVARIQRDPPPDMLKIDPSIPKAVQEIIDRALQKLPENRYSDLSIMEREIRRLRTRLQADEQLEGTAAVLEAGDVTIIKPREPQPNPGELIVAAARALESGDEKAAEDLARRALALSPNDTAATDVLRRIEGRRVEARVRETLQPAEKFLVLDELTSARAALAAAERVNPASPAVVAFKAKLDDAVNRRAATRERVKREREQREQELRVQQERASEQERVEREHRQREEQAREQSRLEREERERQERAREQARLAAERQAREEQERLARERAEREQRDREEQERLAAEQKAREERERLAAEEKAREERERLAAEEKAREAQERLAKERRDREQREQEERERRARDEKAREQERLAREQQAREERERFERELREQRERADRERIERERVRQEAELRKAQQQEQQARDERARAQRETAEKAEHERKQKEAEEADRQQRLRDLARLGAPDPGEPSDATMKLSREALRPPGTTPPNLTKSKPQVPPPTARPTRQSVPAAASPPSSAAPTRTGTPPRSVGPTRKSKRYTVKPASPESVTPAAGIPVQAGANPRPVPPPAPAPPAVVSAGPSPTAAPKTPASPAMPPITATRTGVSPTTLGLAALVGLILIGAIGGWLWVRSRGTTTTTVPPQQQAQPPDSAPPPTPPSSTPPTTTETSAAVQPPADPPAPASMSTVYIDLRPWARVKIVPATPNPAISTETFYAPFAIDLPAGDYNLEAENGGVTRPTTFQLKVAEGGPQTFVRTMPGFNATKIVEGLLGQD